MKKQKNLNILVVQQEEYEREHMVSLLSKGSVNVQSARDGQEALDIMDMSVPDILVTDIALEKVNGLELIKRTREMSDGVRVIVVFGPYNPRGVLQAVQLNVDAFLQLPVDAVKLRGAVVKCVQDMALARRMAQADYSLRQMLDFFPGPALLADGLEVTYLNRRMADYLGYESYSAMQVVDMGLEDFIVKVNDAPYDNHPTAWIRAFVDDPLDRDHVLHIENPRHPDARPSAFSVTFNQFPGSELRLFSFQDVSGLEDERAHLEDEASTDPLTKALNRRSFLRLLGATALAQEPFCLIMFDIDHFKSVNDTYGHDVGDAVLKEISALVRDNIRETDTLARWGGEEFMVLCTRSGLERGKRMAERLRAAVESFDFTGVPRQITSSFGLAVHQSDESSEDLIKRADEALYEAKEGGRNRVLVG